MSEERQPIDIPGSSSKEAGARVRTTSEASEDGNSTGAGKRSVNCYSFHLIQAFQSLFLF